MAKVEIIIPNSNNSSSLNHNNLDGLQGGQVGEYYHLTQEEYSNLNSQDLQSVTDNGYTTTNPILITGDNKAVVVFGLQSEIGVANGVPNASARIYLDSDINPHLSLQKTSLSHVTFSIDNLQEEIAVIRQLANASGNELLTINGEGADENGNLEINVEDIGLELTTEGTTGESTLLDGKLNIPRYDLSAVSFVQDITELEAYAGDLETLIVKDNLRGGIFNYVATGVVDNGITFSAIGKGAGYWERQHKEQGVDVRWFGAIPDYDRNTNTGTDNWQAFTDAINSAERKATSILVYGNYAVGQELELGQTTFIKGVTTIFPEQQSHSISNPDPIIYNPQSAIWFNNNTNGFVTTQDTVFYRSQGIRIEDLGVFGGGLAQGKTGLLLTSNANQTSPSHKNPGLPTVRGCHFYGWDIAVNGVNSDSFYFQNNHVSDGRIGVIGGVSDLFVDTCDFWDLTEYGVKSNGSNDHITMCEFEVNDSNSINLVIGETSRNSTITNNSFKQAKNNIKFLTSSNANVYRGHLITGNQFYTCFGDEHILSETGVSNILIKNNLFRNESSSTETATKFINLTGVSGLVVQGNIFDKLSGGTLTKPITVSGSTEINLDNNRYYGFTLVEESPAVTTSTYSVFSKNTSFGTSLNVFRTTDITTNTEKGIFGYNGSNELEIGHKFEGTGTSSRKVKIGTGASAGLFNRTIDIQSNAPFFSYQFGTTGVAGYGSDFFGGNTFNSSSNLQGGMSVLPTINQSGTASFKTLYISPYFQNVGSGTKYLLDVGKNSAANNAGTHTSYFTLDHNGLGNFTNTVTFNNSPIVPTATTTGQAVPFEQMNTALGSYIPLAGTEEGNPITGDLEINQENYDEVLGFKVKQISTDAYRAVGIYNNGNSDEITFGTITDLNKTGVTFFGASGENTNISLRIEEISSTDKSSIVLNLDEINISANREYFKGIVGDALFNKQNDPNAFAQLGDVTPTVSYSTTETLTGGTWIDGKPIYRKVFSILTTLYSDNIVLSGLNIEEIVSSSSVLNVENNIEAFIPVPFTSSTLLNSTTPISGVYLLKESVDYKIYNDEERIEVDCSKTQYSMIDASIVDQVPLYPDGKLYITLEYTKTTD